MSEQTPAERRAAWIAALRSGTYQQARNALRDGDRFCCLGVACDLFDPSAWDGQFYLDGDYPCDGYMPARVRNTYSLPQEFESELQIMNDTGHSFSAIADRIERYEQERSRS